MLKNVVLTLLGALRHKARFVARLTSFDDLAPSKAVAHLTAMNGGDVSGLQKRSGPRAANRLPKHFVSRRPVRSRATLSGRALALPGALLLAGCSELAYYGQSIGGQVRLLAERRPLATLVADPATPPALRERLELAASVREFASSALGLPRDGSYHSYVQLDAPYVVWSVVAAPPLSLEPRTWCFPVAGCVAYRGYFDQADAHAFGERLRAAGDDVYVGGVAAYSTLGWFDDPLLSSMLEGPDFDVAGVVFHELAHRRLYLAGESDFNEAFAVTVEREGVRRWLRARGDEALREAYEQTLRRRDTLVALVLSWRERLQQVYRSPASEPERLAAKHELLAGLRAAYAERVRADAVLAGAERWLAEDLNNAKLASVATYHALVPAFEALLAESGGDLPVFYEAVEALTRLSGGARDGRLQALLARARGPAQGRPTMLPSSSSGG